MTKKKSESLGKPSKYPLFYSWKYADFESHKPKLSTFSCSWSSGRRFRQFDVTSKLLLRFCCFYIASIRRCVKLLLWRSQWYGIHFSCRKSPKRIVPVIELIESCFKENIKRRKHMAKTKKRRMFLNFLNILVFSEYPKRPIPIPRYPYGYHLRFRYFYPWKPLRFSSS